MKKSIYLILSLVVLMIVSACSTVKVLDHWKADGDRNIQKNNILVIARTENTQARIAFENEIVSQLSAKGMKATASFTKFPKFNPDEKMTEDRKKLIKTMIESEGFDAVVITVLKDYQESLETTTTGGYYAGGTYGSYYGGYYGGFYNYYHNPYAYSSYGAYVPSSTSTYVSKTYIVETSAYNLKLDEKDQLVAVVTSKVEDPSSVSKTAKDYVSAITKSFADNK